MAAASALRPEPGRHVELGRAVDVPGLEQLVLALTERLDVWTWRDARVGGAEQHEAPYEVRMCRARSRARPDRRTTSRRSQPVLRRGSRSARRRHRRTRTRRRASVSRRTHEDRDEPRGTVRPAAPTARPTAPVSNAGMDQEDKVAIGAAPQCHTPSARADRRSGQRRAATGLSVRPLLRRRRGLALERDAGPGDHRLPSMTSK